MLLCLFNYLLYSGAFRFIVKSMLRYTIIFCLILSLPPAAAEKPVEALQTLVKQQKFGSAIQSGESLMLKNAQSPQVIFLTAYAYQMNNQGKEAEALYQQLISQHPELPEPRNNLAMIYQARGDYDAASKLLVEAIETHESYATAYRNLGRIYTGIASEAYRRALSESVEPANYTHNIELSALSRLNLPDETLTVEPGPEKIAQQKTIGEGSATIMETLVKQWADAWSDKDFVSYTSFYSTDHKAGFETHSAWLESRRQRILRPGFIKVRVSDFNIRAQNDGRAIIDFKQSFDSPTYSDRVIKRLGLKRTGNQWKIVEERVLSVL